MTPDWQIHDRFLELRSRWMTLIGEHLLTETGEQLEYWRVERADSVIILPIQADRLLLPPPAYRPGVGHCTLDFPGGRVPTGQTAAEAIPGILQRELGLPPQMIEDLQTLNVEGWPINSSFSNQKLFGFVAEIHPDVRLSPESIGTTVLITEGGIQDLLQHLTCLQCRAVLLEWWQRHPGLTA
ncbi:NUDIX hydrolase [Leptolyngbya sp. 'hensonii']|uniref:NUDIX hydrolase n=1 Tax=Leptolyngbya sp. 'hensonii' TaxID=1922337 RepID=UPI00095030A9|nr:NUDIX hydrolase [Leptolyngbya sp. 'hensonii']OLP17383.1 NUDIX hydrolase [Leptolyngbya sp. 'hensonii']